MEKKASEQNGNRTRFSRKTIFKEFKEGVYYEDLYQKYHITQEDLIEILHHHVKGNYDYQKILQGGKVAQEKFLVHLRNRWNPLGEYEHIPL